jgi:hypothetical protein
MPAPERQDALILHRLTACSRTDDLRDWFHAAALRSVPDVRMLTLAPARRLHDLAIASRPPPDTDAYADDALFHPPPDIMPHVST